MELLNKIRKSRKGFTLVEIIVVLVILAILAAFTIPAMLGFVGDAKKKAAIAEQREVYVAAQAIVTERFAKDKPADLLTAFDIAALPTGTNIVEVPNLSSVRAYAASTKGTGVASQMKNYLSGDIAIAKKATDTTGAIWTVKIDKDGYVKEVTYTRDGIVLEPLKPSNSIKN